MSDDLIGMSADPGAGTVTAPTGGVGRRWPVEPNLIVGAVVVVAALVAAYLWDSTQTTAVVARSVREATPLILGALCGLIGERSGIVNIGIEGQFLLGAFSGFMAASYTGNLWVGLAAAIIATALSGLFLAWTANALRMDQIIAGTILNMFAAGVTSFLYVSGRTMPNIPTLSIPGLDQLPLVGRALFDQGPLTYVALAMVLVVHVALFHTRWGLRTRAIGEHPSAADYVGVRVRRLRYVNLALAGALAGLAGMALLQSAGAFNRGMSGGRGFIALAVMIFGRWRPGGVLAAALLLGLFNGIQAQLQFRGTFDIPPQFIGMIPFVLTIVVLAVAGVRARPPAAAGQPYDPE